MTDPEIEREAERIVKALRRGPRRQVQLPPLPEQRRDAIIRQVRARLLKDR